MTLFKLIIYVVFGMKQWEEKPVKVVQWARKPYFKKKRSFKRQRSQVVARQKPEQTSTPGTIFFPSITTTNNCYCYFIFPL